MKQRGALVSSSRQKKKKNLEYKAFTPHHVFEQRKKRETSVSFSPASKPAKAEAEEKMRKRRGAPKMQGGQRLRVPVRTCGVADLGMIAASCGREPISGSGVLLGGELASGDITILGFSYTHTHTQVHRQSVKCYHSCPPPQLLGCVT